MKKKPLISLIIPTVPENYKLLCRCVSTFCNYKSPEYDYEFCIIPNDWTGYEPNVNKALKMCKGDYILFTNDDVWIKKGGWENLMIKRFTKGVGMVGGTGYSWKECPSFWFVMISKEIFNRLGLLDERFVLYSSDHDYGMRVKQAGYKIVNFQLLNYIGHLFCATSKRVPKEKELMEQAKKMFFKKWNLKNDHRKKTKYIELDKDVLEDENVLPGIRQFTVA